MRNTKIIELIEGSYVELNFLDNNPKELHLTADDDIENRAIVTMTKKQVINTANALLELAKDMED